MAVVADIPQLSLPVGMPQTAAAAAVVLELALAAFHRMAETVARLAPQERRGRLLLVAAVLAALETLAPVVVEKFASQCSMARKQ